MPPFLTVPTKKNSTPPTPGHTINHPAMHFLLSCYAREKGILDGNNSQEITGDGEI